MSNSKKAAAPHLALAEPPETPAEYRTLLSTWEHLLTDAQRLAAVPVRVPVATRMLGAYLGLTFADLEPLNARYYEHVAAMLEVLQMEIAAAPEATFQVTTAEEDGNDNRGIYKAVIYNWRLYLHEVELSWRAGSETAAIDVAVLGELTSTFFSQNGLVSLLENLMVEFSEEENDELHALLVAREIEVNGE